MNWSVWLCYRSAEWPWAVLVTDGQWLADVSDKWQPLFRSLKANSAVWIVLNIEGDIGTDFSLSSAVFPCQYHSTAALHAYISSGGWTAGLLVAAVQRRSLIASTWTAVTTHFVSVYQEMALLNEYGMFSMSCIVLPRPPCQYSQQLTCQTLYRSKWRDCSQVAVQSSCILSWSSWIVDRTF
jgi:hypothetical protein